MNSMFETLLGLPLFKGASRERMAQVVGMAKFHFLKYPQGHVFMRAGDPCTHLAFILSGSVRISTLAPDGALRIGQTLEAPQVITPEFLFGRTTAFPCTAKALTNINVMYVSKADYLKILSTDPVFMLNYLNLLSSRSQLGYEEALRTADPESSIATWILCLTQPGATDITISHPQDDMAALLSSDSHRLPGAMESLREKGCLSYTTREIKIKDRRPLFRFLSGNNTESAGITE